MSVDRPTFGIVRAGKALTRVQRLVRRFAVPAIEAANSARGASGSALANDGSRSHIRCSIGTRRAAFARTSSSKGIVTVALTPFAQDVMSQPTCAEDQYPADGNAIPETELDEVICKRVGDKRRKKH
jgi:hypothetical protein